MYRMQQVLCCVHPTPQPGTPACEEILRLVEQLIDHDESVLTSRNPEREILFLMSPYSITISRLEALCDDLAARASRAVAAAAQQRGLAPDQLLPQWVHKRK